MKNVNSPVKAQKLLSHAAIKLRYEEVSVHLSIQTAG